MPATSTALVLALISLADPPRSKEPPTKEHLAATTRRGRELAEYDSAVWHASDAVQARNPRPGSVVRYVAHKPGKDWVVAFGRLDDDRGKFLIAYEVTSATDPARLEVKSFDPPRPDAGYLRSAARAIDVGLKDFLEHVKGPPRPYNVAVLPAEDSRLWVYLVPAQTKPNLWPLGGDARYLLTGDGAKVVERRQLHNTIIEAEAPKPKGDDQLAMGFHTHVLDDVPEDTDVFYVLSRKPNVPEVISTAHFVFMVEADGSIEYLGKPEELLKQ